MGWPACPSPQVGTGPPLPDDNREGAGAAQSPARSSPGGEQGTHHPVRRPREFPGDRRALRPAVARAAAGQALDVQSAPVPAEQGRSGMMTTSRWLRPGSLSITQYLGQIFFMIALAAIRRRNGAPLEQAGLIYLMGLCWLAKPLWAHHVDRIRFGRLGHYRGWLLSATQDVAAAPSLWPIPKSAGGVAWPCWQEARPFRSCNCCFSGNRHARTVRTRPRSAFGACGAFGGGGAMADRAAAGRRRPWAAQGTARDAPGGLCAARFSGTFLTRTG